MTPKGPILLSVLLICAFSSIFGVFFYNGLASIYGFCNHNLSRILWMIFDCGENEKCSFPHNFNAWDSLMESGGTELRKFFSNWDAS